MKKIYFDAEFTGLHRNTTLISIGLVTEEGRTFYAEFTDYDRSQVNDWIRENVIANLTLEDKDLIYDRKSYPEQDNFNVFNIVVKGNRYMIADRLKEWLEAESKFNTPQGEFDPYVYFVDQELDGKIEKNKLMIMTDCYAYDWVLLVDLITSGGSALDMPDYIYYIPIDLSTLIWSEGEDPDISRENFSESAVLPRVSKHNSLYDAMVIRACFQVLGE